MIHAFEEKTANFHCKEHDISSKQVGNAYFSTQGGFLAANVT